MTFGPVFETGSMAGLMAVFWRHSRKLTNFKIYYPESRPYCSRRAYLDLDLVLDLVLDLGLDLSLVLHASPVLIPQPPPGPARPWEEEA